MHSLPFPGEMSAQLHQEATGGCMSACSEAFGAREISVMLLQAWRSPAR